MSRLLLLRHAKAADAEPGVADVERPLVGRGRRAATLVGEHMVRHRLVPDRVLCSASRRTRETLAALLPNLAGDIEIRQALAIYEPRAGNYLEVIARHGGRSATLLVIGHNPAMQETAALLVGAGSADLREEAVSRFPTAGLAVIDFDATRWDAATPGSGRIVAFFRPRDLEVVGGDGGDDDG